MARAHDPALLLAAEQAVELGALRLRQGRLHVGTVTAKGDRDYATAVDVAITREVRALLRQRTPWIPFLGEEESGAALGEGAVWVLDPIDGTVNFTHGSPLCAISLALAVDGALQLGIVDLPLLSERYVAIAGRGAYLNGTRIAISPTARLSDAVVGITDFAVGEGAGFEDRVHLAIVEQLAVSSLRVRTHGSAALDLAWLGTGRLDASLMLSKLPWDASAGVLVAHEAGADVYDREGSPYGPYSRFTIASSPALRPELLELVGDALAVPAEA